VPWAAGLEWFARGLRPTSAWRCYRFRTSGWTSQTPKMNSSNTILTFLTGHGGRAARPHAAERRTNPDDHRSQSTELLSSVGVGGGASRRFSELVKPATSWSAGC